MFPQEWGDENLAWSPEEYNGIRTLRVPAAFVWLPDTFIFNKQVLLFFPFHCATNADLLCVGVGTLILYEAVSVELLKKYHLA